MELSVINRSLDQSWLSNFLEIIKEKFLTSHNAWSTIQETIKNDILPEDWNMDSVDSLDQIVIIRENLSKVLVKGILADYLQLIDGYKLPSNEELKIAFDFYGSGILVWVEPSAANPKLEEYLRDAEVIINTKYSNQQIELNTIVFDKSFGFEFPPKYV